MKTSKVPLHQRKEMHVGEPSHVQAFSGVGILPDVISEHAATTLAVANRTNLEGGIPHGREGMLPPPGMTRRVNPAYVEGTSGGAGSFNTSIAAPKGQR